MGFGSMSDKKYQTMDQLVRSAKYWRDGEAFAKGMIEKIWNRAGYESPLWRGKQCAAREKARAYEAEIARRKSLGEAA